MPRRGKSGLFGVRLLTLQQGVLLSHTDILLLVSVLENRKRTSSATEGVLCVCASIMQPSQGSNHQPSDIPPFPPSCLPLSLTFLSSLHVFPSPYPSPLLLPFPTVHAEGVHLQLLRT